jgi:outer membrane protein
MLLPKQSSRNSDTSVSPIIPRATFKRNWLRIVLLSTFVLVIGSPRDVATAQAAGAGQPPTGGAGTTGVVQPQTGVVQIPSGAPPVSPTNTPLHPITPAAPAKAPISTSSGIAYITAHLGPDHPLTLEQAIGVALSNSRALAFAAEALYKADARVAAARSAFQPTVLAQPADVYLHSANAGSFQVAATLPVDISGMLRAAQDQAQFQDVGARLDYNRTRNQVVYDVEAAFYSVLRARALVTVAVQNLQDSLERLRDANVRYKAQAVPYLDVVRAQTDVANAQKVVIQARNTVSTNVGLLNNAMGIDVTLPTLIDQTGAMALPPGIAPVPDINPAGPGAMQSELPAAPAPPTIEEIESSGAAAQRSAAVISQALTLGPEFRKVLEEALNTRPEILEADANISAAKKGIILARRSILPSLSLAVGYFDIRSQTGTPINEPEGIVALNIPLYDGGLARAQVNEAKADVSTAITARREQQDLVTLDVQQAYLNLVQAQDEVAVANQAVLQARTAFEIARVRYNAGVGSKAGLSPILEFEDAQAALTLAEQNRVNALYDYNAARASLDRSIGRFAYLRVGPGYTAPPPAKAVGTKQ